MNLKLNPIKHITMQYLADNCDYLIDQAGKKITISKNYAFSEVALYVDKNQTMAVVARTETVGVFPSGCVSIRGKFYTPYKSMLIDLNTPPDVSAPKCYALIADTSSIMGVYSNQQPDRDQILKCINAYIGYVPEITLEDTFNTLETTCNSELDLNSTIGSAIDELLLHNITSLDMCNCEFTLDEFELEIGKSK